MCELSLHDAEPILQKVFYPLQRAAGTRSLPFLPHGSFLTICRCRLILMSGMPLVDAQLNGTYCEQDLLAAVLLSIFSCRLCRVDVVVL